MYRRLFAVLTVLAADTSCTDKNDRCAEWAGKGECDANPVWMKPNCAESCKTCGGKCADAQDVCADLKSNGACLTMEGWMSANCKKTCNLCCNDEDVRCAAWAKAGQCENTPYIAFMKSKCKRSCKICGSGKNESNTGQFLSANENQILSKQKFVHSKPRT